MTGTVEAGNDEGWFTFAKKPFPNDLKSVISACVPSGFGNLKTGKTEVDKKVRQALENKQDIALTPHGTEFLKELAPYISGFLYGGLPIEFAINKLNIYSTGGFFDLHTDTPRPGVVGTLVLELPFDHSGGQLELYPIGSSLPNKEKSADKAKLGDDTDDDDREGKDEGFSQTKGGSVRLASRSNWLKKQNELKSWSNRARFNTDRTIRFAAFYGNIPHRITPVRSGNRVTVTFYIIAPATPVAPAASSSSSKYVGLWYEYDGERYGAEPPTIGGAPVLFEFPGRAAFNIEPEAASGGHSQLMQDLVQTIFGVPPSAIGSDLIDIARKKSNLHNSRYSAKRPRLSPTAAAAAASTHLGILLSQQYSHSEISSQRWKGLDVTLSKHLVERAQKDGYTVQFVPVVVWHNEHWYSEEAADDNEGNRQQEVYRFTEQDIQMMADEKAQSKTAQEEYVFLGTGNWEALAKFRQHGASHTGNEALADEILNHYFSTACLITPTATASTAVGLGTGGKKYLE